MTIVELERSSPADSARTREQAIAHVESAVADACGALHAASGRLVALTADVIARELWSQDGVRSPEHWLTWKAGVGPAMARRVVAAARRFDELPATMAAAVAGELSLDQIGPIVANAPAWADAQVADLARSCTVSQIRAAVGAYPFDPAPTDVDDAPDDGAPTADGTVGPDGVGSGAVGSGAVGSGAVGSGDAESVGGAIDDGGVDHGEPERFSLVQGDDGRWRVSGVLDADHGLILDAALREIADRSFDDGGRLVGRVEALVELARNHTIAIDDHARRDRYRVHYLLDERHQLVDPYGNALPEWLRDLICCDATMSITWQRHGIPIARSSTSDVIDPAVRRHVLARDHGCRVPGCGRRARLHLHHVRHRAHGGTNDTFNLVAICPQHHRMHHRGHLGITGDADDPDGLTFTNRHGLVLRTNTLMRRSTGPPLETRPYRHPLGERLHTEWITFHPPPTAA